MSVLLIKHYDRGTDLYHVVQFFHFVLRCIDTAMGTGSLVDKSVGISTALCPYLGYKESADIAKTALRENKSVREIVLERKLMSEADLEHVLNPEMMTEVHFEQRKAM